MIAFTLSGSDIAAWTALITAVCVGIAGVIKTLLDGYRQIRADEAIRQAQQAGTRADAKADVLDSRCTSIADHVQSVDRAQTQLAAAMPVPQIPEINTLVQVPPDSPPRIQT